MAIERKKLLKDGVEFFPRTSADSVILDDSGTQNLATKLAEIEKAKVVVDAALKADSTNAIANKAVYGALSAKVSDNEVGAPSGVAPLDANGLVPAAHLPSYVDDVLDTTFALSTATLVASELTYLTDTKKLKQNNKDIAPEKGKIYVCVKSADAQYLNKQYRWSGSEMVEMSKSIALGDVAGTAFPGNRGKNVETLAATTAEDLSMLHDDLNTFDNELQGVKDVQAINEANYTHAQVAALRDAAKLVPGARYRIIDYVCTTTQENTRAIPHRFDIIVTALTRNTLSEVASACFHEGGDEYYFARPTVDNTNTFTLAEDYEEPLVANATVAHKKATLKCGDTSKINIGDVFVSETAYGYFNEGTSSERCVALYLKVESKTATSVTITALNGKMLGSVSECIPTIDIDTVFKKCTAIEYVPIQAWKVWYCLDNDSKRFAWADKVNGKGVIYRLIDENHNDCSYDFKSIQFKRDKTKEPYSYIPEIVALDDYYYTFSNIRVNSSDVEDASVRYVGYKTDDTALECSPKPLRNTLKATHFPLLEGDYPTYTDNLPDNIFIVKQTDPDIVYYGVCETYIGGDSMGHTIVGSAVLCTISENSHSNYFRSAFRSSFFECINSEVSEQAFRISIKNSYSVIASSLMNCTFYGVTTFRCNERTMDSCNINNCRNINITVGGGNSAIAYFDIFDLDKGSSTDINIIAENRSYRTNITANSKGEIVQYCEADLVGAVKAVNV